MSPVSIVLLPTLTQTSSAVDTSTGSPPAWDVINADSVIFQLVGVTTAPQPYVEVAFTSESTATFYKLSQDSSGGALVAATSGRAVPVWPIAYKQMRFATSNVISTSYTVTGGMSVSV